MTVSINNPKMALGIMAIHLFDKIAEYMPLVISTPDGASQVYGLLIELDGLLTTYRDTMCYRKWNPETKKVEFVTYYQKRYELRERENSLQLNNSNGKKAWVTWYGEYLELLASCFNMIGLAPPTFRQFEPDNPNAVGRNPEWDKSSGDEENGTTTDVLPPTDDSSSLEE